MIRNNFKSIILINIAFVVIFANFSKATWNFSNVDLPDDVPIWRFAIWRNRAFLAISSFDKRDKNISSELSLLEASWPEPESNVDGFIAAFDDTDRRIFSKSSSEIDHCQRLRSVVGLDVESRGRLWILDSDDENHCPAKIVIYDLRRNNMEIVRTDLQGVAKINLKTLVIDPFLGISGPRAYIGDPGDESIIVYSLFQRRWWKVRLVSENRIPIFSSAEMAISRKNTLLYLTDPRSEDLFSVDLEIPRNDDGPLIHTENQEIERNASVKWLGTKMGRSSGLVIDQKGGLHYFLITEHASVRWDTKYELEARSYSVLLQNEQVPCITDYRLDSQRNVWGLVNLENPFVKTNSIFFHKWNSQFRTVRIFKHNLFAR